MKVARTNRDHSDSDNNIPSNINNNIFGDSIPKDINIRNLKT